MYGRWLGILASLELREPGVGLLCRDMHARGLIVGPCRQSVLPELLAALLPFDILLDRSRISQCDDRRRNCASCCSRVLISASSLRLVVDLFAMRLRLDVTRRHLSVAAIAPECMVRG
jgi:hypothetical protein